MEILPYMNRLNTSIKKKRLTECIIRRDPTI